MPNDPRNQSGGQIPRGTHEETGVLTKRLHHPIFERVLPRTAIYVTDSDVLSFNITSDVNNLQMLFAYRLMLTDGTIVRFQDTPTYTAAGSGQSFNYHLPEGWLLSASALANGNFVPEGSCLAQIILGQLGGAGVVVGDITLSSGCVQSFNGITWPGYYRTSLESFGWARSTGVGAPAAGLDWSFALSQFRRTRIHTINFSLTTSVAVANRFVRVRLDTGGSTISIVPSGFAQVASTTVNYAFGVGLAAISSDPTLISAPIPQFWENDVTNAFYHVSSQTLNLQAADQLSGVNIFLRQWHESD